MSLKVWLPLDGDLRNLGASNENFSIATALTYTDNGKIGKAYSGGAITMDANTTASILNNQEFSFTCWVYVNSTEESTSNREIFFGNSSMSENNNRKFSIFQYPTCNDLHLSWMNDAASTTFIGGVWAGVFPSYKWTHIAVTYKNPNCTIYVNGAKYDTRTGVSSSSSFEYETYLFHNAPNQTRYLNDYRIYDHCLSAAEVHEIAQGLILHYKLDGFMGGAGDNLLKNSKTFGTGWSGTGTVTANAFENYFSIKYKDNSSGTSYTDAVVYSNVTTVQPGEVYTGSFWAKADTSSNLSCFFYNNTSGVVQVSSIKRSDGTSGNSTDGHSPFTIDNQWRQYWVTWTFGSSGTAATKTFIVCRLNAGKSGISITKVKLEKGDKMTAWTPNSSELGIDTMIIEDSSGYGHNAILNSSLTLNADSPRYFSSSYFSPNIIATSNNLFDQGTLLSEFTWAGWVRRKYDDGKYKIIHSGPANIGLYTDYSLYIGWKSANTDGTTTGNGAAGGSATVPLNTWTHMCITYKDGIGNFYINGNKTKTWDYRGYGTFIEAYGQNYLGASDWDGDLSDIRIYTTALLDTDIKLLYNMGSKIDNLGGIHSFELNENDNNLLAGTVITSSYNNKVNPYTKYNSNGEIYFDTNTTSAGSDYISINPTNHTYYYDFDISLNAGNKFYIGFERYDADKTSRSNNATIYICDTRPTEDINHKHIFGTVDLSTDGVNPCAFIALRILNGWSGTTSGVVGTATIHSMSLREVSTIQNPKLYKNGILLTDEFKEYQKASFYKNGFVEATEFIEI